MKCTSPTSEGVSKGGSVTGSSVRQRMNIEQFNKLKNTNIYGGVFLFIATKNISGDSCKYRAFHSWMKKMPFKKTPKVILSKMPIYFAENTN